MDREAQAFELYWIQKRNSLIAKYYTILHFAFNALLQKIAGIPSQNHHNPRKPETVYRSLDLDHFMSFDELKEDKCTILCMYTWLIFSTRRVQKVSIQYIFAVLNMPCLDDSVQEHLPEQPASIYTIQTLISDIQFTVYVCQHFVQLVA